MDRSRLRAVVLTYRLHYLPGAKVHRLFKEFEADWRLSGKAPKTAAEYCRLIVPLLAEEENGVDSLDLPTVKRWVADGRTPSIRRDRAKAIRTFLKWATNEEVGDFSWWSRIPTVTIPEAPQPTVTEDDYRRVMNRAKTHRDKAIVAVLWSSGMRRSEVARIQVEDLDLDNACISVGKTKSGRPRIAPLSPEAVKALYKYLRTHPHEGPLWQGERGPLTADGIKQVLDRLGAPSPHAWRRGWAVDSLRHGVSQTSVQAAAGWRSGAMVTRYTRTLAGELAIDEYQRRWAS